MHVLDFDSFDWMEWKVESRRRTGRAGASAASCVWSIDTGMSPAIRYNKQAFRAGGHRNVFVRPKGPERKKNVYF